MEPITYDATVRPDGEHDVGYAALSTARYRGTVTITDGAWTGSGDTPPSAIANLERRQQELPTEACRP